MGGNPLVELDELVDLGSGEAPALLVELFEPGPGVLVSQHEGIDVHRAMLVGPVAWVPMMPVPETVVTGDAVVLDVQIAQLPVRAVGALIDIGIVVVGYLIGVMLWAATRASFDEALSAAILVIFPVLGDGTAIRSFSRPRPEAGRWARW